MSAVLDSDGRSMETGAIHERRFQRERRAREQAERLLESKSLELYTARKQVEAERKLLSDAINTMRDGFAILDDDWNLMVWNQALVFHTGLNGVELIPGTGFAALLKRLDVVSFIEETGDSRSELDLSLIDDDRQVQISLECRDGRYLMLCLEPPTGTGKTVTIRDMTLQRNLTRDLSEARKHESLGTMAGGIAHEINTPVQYILSNLEFSQSAFEDLFPVEDDPRHNRKLNREDFGFLRSEIADALKQSINGAQQIGQIVSAVRLYSHPGSGVREPVDIRALLESVVLVTRSQWSPVAHLETFSDLGPEAVPVYQDGLKQVLVNLIVNAAQEIGSCYRNEPGTAGRIRLSTFLVDDELIVKVEDNGSGVKFEDQQQIFDMFFTTKPPGEGTGQGLAISRRIVVEEHGGRIDCGESDLGGACFTVSIPIEG
jgi:signal transduction histidine kinase